jgi:hypothetical protein
MKFPQEQYQTVLKRLEYAKMKGFEEIGKMMMIFRCLTWNGVNFEATFNDYVDVDCDMIAAEYPADAEIIQTTRRGADIDCEVLEDDIGEDDCSEKLPLVGERDTISALETVKSYILTQENVNDDIFYCICGLENFCSSCKRNSMKQVKITDFLK